MDKVEGRRLICCFDGTSNEFNEVSFLDILLLTSISLIVL
jgi:uncharacterized protein (DUF2235 family)